MEKPTPSIDLGVAICTVVTRSHLPYARVLMESVEKFHPEVSRFVLVVDGDGGEVFGDEFKTITLSELTTIDTANFLFQYTAFEACNALKSFLIQHLQTVFSLKRILYLDSDTVLYAKISDILSKLETCSLLLTPHILKDFPVADTKNRSELFLSSGTFNAGVIGVGLLDSVDGFIDWWCSKMRFNCVDQIDRGIYVDQKYLDLVPSLFNHFIILKDDSVNLGYFNIRAKQFKHVDGSWLVDSQPLRIFHFTQFDPDEMRFKAGIQDSSIDSHGEFRFFLKQYASILKRFGFPMVTPYRFNYHDSGLVISKALREHHRHLAKSGLAPKNPFSDKDYERMLRREYAFDQRRRWIHQLLRPVFSVIRIGKRLLHWCLR